MANAIARVCSVLPFHAISTLVAICLGGAGGDSRIGLPLSNRPDSRTRLSSPNEVGSGRLKTIRSQRRGRSCRRFSRPRGRRLASQKKGQLSPDRNPLRPGLFLAAVAQRTKRLRFGPLVYSLPLYHLIRLIEEICMLDQMSGGRFELGVGRGVSPIEVGFYGVNPADGPRQCPEALKVIKQGLTVDELAFSGEFYNMTKSQWC
jgi:hypothetical protein